MAHPAKLELVCTIAPAALVPYLMNFSEPFILISTGTWCISLNPFNKLPLTAEEIKKDCLCYLQYQGKPVKAARLFSGYEHEQQVKRIGAYFNQNIIKYRNIAFDPEIIARLKKNQPKVVDTGIFNKESAFAERDLSVFKSDTEAYHQLVLDLVNLQVASTQLVLKGTTVKRIFVDGGFNKNSIFMHLLAEALLGIEVFAASMAQASPLGAALAIHRDWNTKPVPKRYYSIKILRGGLRRLLFRLILYFLYIAICLNGQINTR